VVIAVVKAELELVVFAAVDGAIVVAVEAVIAVVGVEAEAAAECLQAEHELGVREAAGPAGGFRTHARRTELEGDPHTRNTHHFRYQLTLERG